MDGIQLSFGITGLRTCAVSTCRASQHHLRDGGDGSAHGNAAFFSNKAGDENILVENNLLAGGGYTLYCHGSTGINYRVINNRFSTRFSAKVGYWGRDPEFSDEVPVWQRHLRNRATADLGGKSRASRG